MAEEPVAAEPEVLEPATNGTHDAAEAPSDPEARYRYDESLLLKGKGGKVRRPAKPDESERNLAIEKLKAEVEKRSARIKDIKDIQEKARSTRSSGQAGNQEIVKKLQGLRNEFQTVLRQKQHIREELNAALKGKDEQRNLLRQLRDRLPNGVKADGLEEKITELEFKLAHESAQDDKALFRRIQELTQARPLFKEYSAAEASLKAYEDKRVEVQQRLQQCDAVLNDIKAREDAERTALDQSRNKQNENQPDIPTLNVEKKECWDIIQALRAKMDEIRKEFNEKYTEYIKLDRNYNNYIRSQKRKEYEERQKKRAEAAAEGGEEAGEPAADGTPAAPRDVSDAPVVEAYAAEVFTLDQLLVCLRKLVPADDKSSANQAEKKEVEVPQGMKLLKKADAEDFMPISKKDKRQGKGKGAPEPAPAAAAVKAAADPAKKKLNHGFETLRTFMQFGVEVPQTTAELPAAIEKVQAKKDYYLELRRTGKKHTPAPEPKPREAPAAASSSSAAEPDAAAASSSSQPASEPAAAAPAASSTPEPAPTPAVAAPAPKSAAPVNNPDGLDVDLSVDKTTEEVSIKLRVSDSA